MLSSSRPRSIWRNPGDRTSLRTFKVCLAGGIFAYIIFFVGYTLIGLDASSNFNTATPFWFEGWRSPHLDPMIDDLDWPQSRQNTKELPIHETLEKAINEMNLDQREEIEALERSFNFEYLNFGYNPQCGSWQREHRRKHLGAIQPERIKRAMEDASRGIDPSNHYIVHWCPTGKACGGFADHMLAAMSTFLYCLLNNKTFLMDWNNKIWSPFNFDWRATQHAYPLLPGDDPRWTSVDWHNYPVFRMHYVWNYTNRNADALGREGREMVQSLPFFRITHNRGSLMAALTSHHEEELRGMGLTRHNIYSCIWQYMFRLDEMHMRFVNKYRAFLSHPDVFSVGIHLRNWDSAFTDETFKVADGVLDQWTRCAVEVARDQALAHQKVVFLVFSDNLEAPQRFRSQFPRETILTPGNPAHFAHMTQVNQDTLKVVTDNLILSFTTYSMVTKSGFGRLAVFRRGEDDRTLFMESAWTSCRGIQYHSLQDLAGIWSGG